MFWSPLENGVLITGIHWIGCGVAGRQDELRFFRLCLSSSCEHKVLTHYAFTVVRSRSIPFDSFSIHERRPPYYDRVRWEVLHLQWSWRVLVERVQGARSS